MTSAPGAVGDCLRSAERHARELGHPVRLSEGIMDVGHGLARIWAFWRCPVDDEFCEAEETIESDAATPGPLPDLLEG